MTAALNPNGEAVTISLPWPPSVNAYWRHVVMGKHARVLVSREGKAYQTKAAGALLRQRCVVLNLEGPLAVHIVVYPPDRRKRDLDNIPKAVLDCLTRAEVWGDDSQIEDLRITRRHVVKGGSLAITITRPDPDSAGLEWCSKEKAAF